MLESFSKDDLHDWIDAQTVHLDVVASWETLCMTYDELRFIDQIPDATRLDEFKWIIKEMNKFLSRMRTKLMNCKDADAVRKALQDSFTPMGQVNLSDRQSLCYQKLRQSWIRSMLKNLEMMMLDQINHQIAMMEEEING